MKNEAKTVFEQGNIRIYCEDFLETKAIEPNSVDLIVTSPPYDVDIKYENYDDSIPYDQYLEFTEKMVVKMLRVG